MGEVKQGTSSITALCHHGPPYSPQGRSRLLEKDSRRAQQRHPTWSVSPDPCLPLLNPLVLRFDGLSVPKTPLPLLNFNDPDTLTWMRTMSDSSSGGFSSAQLTQIPATADVPTHALFHGSISTKLPVNRPDIHRTGYAAFRNADRGRTAFGDLYWDIDSYTYLALRVKSDGRKYFINIQTDSIVPTDIHQHRLYTRLHRGTLGPDDPGQWETVLIRFNEFVRTNHGTVTEPQSEMLRAKIKSFGIGLIDRKEGDFDLAIGALWATNLNERGKLDGWMAKGEAGDLGSARLGEVTEEKMARKREEMDKLPERGNRLKDVVPEWFGKVGTDYAGKRWEERNRRPGKRAWGPDKEEDEDWDEREEERDEEGQEERDQERDERR